MSLDVYLEVDEPVTRPVSSGIFVRENGQTVEISREEWDRRYPDREPVTVRYDDETTRTVYSANITHNLNTMASEAGIYEHLWRPDEIGVTKAEQLIQPLCDGLARLHTEPERFKAFNPSNGWGDYDGLVRFVADYLVACVRHPQATVRVDR